MDLAAAYHHRSFAHTWRSRWAERMPLAANDYLS